MTRPLRFWAQVVLWLVLALARRDFAQAATPLQLGADASGFIDVPGAEVDFTFTGAAGQRLFYDALNQNSQGLSAQFFSPSGALLSSFTPSQDRGPFTLLEAGTYRLHLDGNGGATNSFAFSLLDLAAAQTFTPGTQVNGQLNPRNRTTLYRLAGHAGQRLSIKRLASSANDASWYLFSPADDQLLSANVGGDLGTVTLPLDGNYTLLITGYGTAATPLTYQFLAVDLSDTPVASSGFGDIHSGNLTKETNQFTFTGAAGRWVYFDSQDRNNGVVVDVRAPPGTNAPILTIGANTDSGPYVLPASGIYTISVRGSGAYRFRWLDATAAPSLTLNGDTSATLPAPYQTEVYLLNAQAGQSFYYDALDPNNSNNVLLRLYNPAGNLIQGPRYSDSDIAPFLAPVTGPYYLFMENNTASTVDYHFRFLESSGYPVLPFNTVVGNTLARGNSATLYRFTGQTGEHLFFDGQGTNNQLGMYLYAPNNTYLAYAGLQANFETTLPGDGTYLLLITGDNTNAVTYSFRAVTPATKTAPLTLGATISGHLTDPGEIHQFTFTGTPGQRLFFDGQAGEPNMYRRLVAPSGLDVISQTSVTSDGGPVTLGETGVYTLIIDAYDQITGDYAFRLLDISKAPVLPLPLNTEIGSDLVPVPANALNVTGTYINQSLRGVTNTADWRTTQTVAGTRKDPILNFAIDTFGPRAGVGITGGTDSN
ncbi:MAG TPA: hypothetical protein VHH73_13905, partial [Verrucomicrobiae bacterium]|nr:hypothetical protein [Verrucomicrobiae bacterium]